MGWRCGYYVYSYLYMILKVYITSSVNTLALIKGCLPKVYIKKLTFTKITRLHFLIYRLLT